MSDPTPEIIPQPPESLTNGSATTSNAYQIRPQYLTQISLDGKGGYQFFTSEAPKLELVDMSDIATAGSNTLWQPKDQTDPLKKLKPLNSSSLQSDGKTWANVSVGGIEGGGQNYMANTLVQAYVNDQKMHMQNTYSIDDTLTISSSSGSSICGVTIPLKTMLFNSGKTHDISWDVKPTHYNKQSLKFNADGDKASTSQRLFPLTKNPRWYRRAGVHVIDHPEFGTKKFFVATDILGRFYVYPVDYTPDEATTMLTKAPLYKGHFVNESAVKVWDVPWSTIGKEPTVKTFTRPTVNDIASHVYPCFGKTTYNWDTTKPYMKAEYPDGGVTDGFHGMESGFDVKLNSQPFQYLWSFNYNATKATAIIYVKDSDSLPSKLKTLKGERKPISKIDCLPGIIFEESIASNVGIQTVDEQTIPPPEKPFEVEQVFPYYPMLVEVTIEITVHGEGNADFGASFYLSKTEGSQSANKYYVACGYTHPEFEKDPNTDEVITENVGPMVDGEATAPARKKVKKEAELSYAYLSLYGKSTLEETEELTDLVFEKPPAWEDESKLCPQAFLEQPEQVEFVKMLMGIEPYSLEIITNFLKKIDNFTDLENILVEVPAGSYNIPPYPPLPRGLSTYYGFPDITWEIYEALLTSGHGIHNPDRLLPSDPPLPGHAIGYPLPSVIIPDKINTSDKFRKLLTESLRMYSTAYTSAERTHYFKNYIIPYGDVKSRLFSYDIEVACDLPQNYRVTPAPPATAQQPGPTVMEGVGRRLYDTLLDIPALLLWDFSNNRINWKWGSTKYSNFLKDVSTFVQDQQVLNGFLYNVDHLAHKLLVWGMCNLAIDKIPTTGGLKVYLKSIIAQTLQGTDDPIDFSSGASHQGYVDDFLRKLPKGNGQIVEGVYIPNIRLGYSVSETKIADVAVELPKPIFKTEEFLGVTYCGYEITMPHFFAHGKKVHNFDAMLTIVKGSDEVLSINMFRTDYAHIKTQFSFRDNFPKVEANDVITSDLLSITNFIEGTHNLYTSYNESYYNIDYMWLYSRLPNNKYSGTYFTNSLVMSFDYLTNKDTHNVSVAAIDFGNSSVLLNGMRANWHYPSTFSIGNALYIKKEAYRKNGMFADIDVMAMPPRESTLLDITKYRLLYEAILIEYFKNDVIVNESCHGNNKLHETNWEDSPYKYAQSVYTLSTKSNIDTQVIESFLGSSPDESVFAYQLPLRGCCDYISGVNGSTDYDIFVSPLFKTAFESGWSTIDHIQVINPKYDKSKPEKAERLIVTSHKNLFNKAFSQGRDYTHYTEQGKNGYLGGFCTSGAWFTYRLPILDKDLTNDALAI